MGFNTNLDKICFSNIVSRPAGNFGSRTRQEQIEAIFGTFKSTYILTLWFLVISNKIYTSLLAVPSSILHNISHILSRIPKLGLNLFTTLIELANFLGFHSSLVLVLVFSYNYVEKVVLNCTANIIYITAILVCWSTSEKAMCFWCQDVLQPRWKATEDQLSRWQTRWWWTYSSLHCFDSKIWNSSYHIQASKLLGIAKYQEKN